MYGILEPYTYADAKNNYSLQEFLKAIGEMYEEIIDLAYDTADGHDGWTLLTDVTRVPSKAIDWLSQFVGVRQIEGLTDAQKIQRIAAREGFSRGTPGGMRAAAQVFLTGGQTVNIFERDTSPYHMAVQTYESQTPPADLPTTNIVPNGGFETNLTGWSSSANARSTDYAHSGVASLKSSALTYEYTTFAIPVAVGDVFVVSVWRKCVNHAGSGGGAAVVVEPGTGAYDQVSLPGSAPQSALNAGNREWERVMTKYTITNAGTGVMPLILTAMYGGTGTSGFAYFDDVQIERKSVATPYVHTDGAPASRPAGQGPVGAALLSQKPAGIVMVYSVMPGQNYQQLKAAHSPYSAVKSFYSNYSKVRNDTP